MDHIIAGELSRHAEHVGGEVKSSSGLRPPANVAEKDVRNALDRIVASPAFRASPQLASFLTFVVEATLSGRSERIKGYTIAVEALGRDADFDPQADPIVRVEAGRLRRALARYYDGPGNTDPIMIDLPRGSYVPTIRRREVVPEPWLRKAGALLAGLDVRLPAALFAALILLGIVAHAGVELLGPGSRSRSAAVTAATTRMPPPRLFVGPSIVIEPVRSAGEPRQEVILPAVLENRLRDIFARFDDVTIISAPLRPGEAGYAPGEEPPADYRLATSIEYNADGPPTVRFQFIDEADGSIVWARTIDRFEVGTPSASKYPNVRQVAAALLQPFGVVHSRERIKRAALPQSESRYACLLESFEYFRGYDLPRHRHIRACLEDVTRRDPTFASGFSSLARLYFREYLFGLSDDDEARPLDRALELARRAIELKPNHVRAYYVMLDIHMARGEIAEAIAAGEKAIALNPYDTAAVFHHGAQLILLGEIEKGLHTVNEAGRPLGAPPPRYQFIQSLAAYLKDDFAGAAVYAKQITNERFPLGFVMRAVTSLKTGDREQAQRAISRLLALHPSWQSDLRAELNKYFPAPWIVDRIVGDLRQAGFGMTAMGPSSRSASATTALPTVLIEPFEVTGNAPLNATTPAALRAQLLDAFSRFEDVNVLSGPDAKGGRERAAEDYRFLTSMDFKDGAADVTFRLVDVSAGSVVWEMSYDGLRRDGGRGETALLGEMAATLLHPTGVVAAREQAHPSSRSGAERYRCFLDAYDYLRGFDWARHASIRGCLEEAVMTDPSFAGAWVALARIYLREHQFSAGPGLGDRLPLERARHAARHAIEINSQSARAHLAMAKALAGMGDMRGLRNYGDRAVALNPYDPSVVFHYGAQLVTMGEIEAGEAMIRRAGETSAVAPARRDFALFMASYLKGDLESASRSARRLDDTTFLPGYVARALIAARTSGPEETRQAVERLAATDPSWRIDPRTKLGRFITSPALVKRFADDLAMAGLWSPQTASQSRPPGQRLVQ